VAAERVAVLTGPRVTLRPLAERDIEPLAAIGTAPEVARWWPGITGEHLRGKLAGGGGETALAIELDGRTVGLIEIHEELTPDFRHAGLDVFLDPAVHGRGVGREAVWQVAHHLVHERGHHRLVIDPAADNVAAIRCYTAVGFRPVGILRQYERGPDGTWHDGLLMDLLTEELAP
jgi:aminoglycoside 6'-N-acetyltransferase